LYRREIKMSLVEKKNKYCVLLGAFGGGNYLLEVQFRIRPLFLTEGKKVEKSLHKQLSITGGGRKKGNDGNSE